MINEIGRNVTDRVVGLEKSARVLKAKNLDAGEEKWQTLNAYFSVLLH
jgi:hypothetical protein